MKRFTVSGLLIAWLVVAAFLGATGRVAVLRPPVPQFILAGLIVACLVLARIPSVSAWIERLSVRSILSFHLTRFVGLYFLYLAAQNRLAAAFAWPAGVGDIVVAVGAGILLVLRNPSARILGVWNSLGLVDLIFVVATAARTAMRDPSSMRALLEFPLSLLPTWLVPLLITSHVVLFRRLRKAD